MRNRLFSTTLFLISVFSLSAMSQEPESDLSVEFFRPELTSIKSKKATLVTVSGRTKPGSKVTIAGGKVIIIGKNNKVAFLEAETVVASQKNESIANPEGLFTLKLKLPFSRIQLPLLIEDHSKDGVIAKSYQVNMEVTKEEVVVLNQEGMRESPLFAKKYGLWAGLGLNYVAYSQVSSATGADLDLETFKGPSYYGKFWWRINDDWATYYSYNISPGEVDEVSSGLNLVGDGEYDWTILVAQGMYYPKEWRGHDFKGHSRWGLIGGLQYHNVPFLSRTGASSSAVEIETNDLIMLTFGGLYLLDKKRWTYEGYLRYQYPISSGSVFDISPTFAFDGSVGAYFKWKGNWRIGGFWYGQWHSYDYTHRDKFLGSNVKGEQELFFSNFEARLGYEYQ